MQLLALRVWRMEFYDTRNKGLRLVCCLLVKTANPRLIMVFTHMARPESLKTKLGAKSV